MSEQERRRAYEEAVELYELIGWINLEALESAKALAAKIAADLGIKEEVQ
jgi:hypothetical protein